MEFFGKYPLLTKLLLIQFVTISCGLLVFLEVYQFTEQAQLASSMSRLKEQVAQPIASREEQWRAWKYLGLESAIQEEVAPLLERFPIKTLKVIYRRDQPNPLPINDMIFPAQNMNPDDYIVLAELNPDQIEISTHAKSTVRVAAAGIAFLFLGIILFSGRYIYRRVYLPILTLNQILSRRDGNDTNELDSVPAIGEMRDFLNNLSITLSKSIEEKQALAREAALVGIAKSVAHDIRSPLSALNMLLGVADAMPDDQRDLMRAAITRINRIADGLLQRSKKGRPLVLASDKSKELISNTVTSLVAEKRLEMRAKKDLSFDLMISPAAMNLFSDIDSNEFGRVVSNLLNNAVESGASDIKIRLQFDNGEIKLSVSDNGKGIPPSILTKLGSDSFSFEKVGGSGLGLLSLKRFASNHEIAYDIDSVVGTGTSVALRMKVAPRSSWLWNPSQLAHAHQLIIVDDDPSIPIFWRRHLGSALLELPIRYFSSPAEFEQWRRDVTLSNTDLVLMDFNFENDQRNGIEIALENAVTNQCVIVTARSLDNEFVQLVVGAGLVLFPKSHIGLGDPA